MYFILSLLKSQSSWAIDKYTPLDHGGNRGVGNLAFTFRSLEDGSGVVLPSSVLLERTGTHSAYSTWHTIPLIIFLEIPQLGRKEFLEK